jgi:hypothetical protein
MPKDFSKFTNQPKSVNAGGMLPPTGIVFTWADCIDVKEKDGKELAYPYQECLLLAGEAEYKWRMSKMLVSTLTPEGRFVTAHEYTDDAFSDYFKYVEVEDEEVMVLDGAALPADVEFDKKKHVRLANGKAYPFRRVPKIIAVACKADGSDL